MIHPDEGKKKRPPTALQVAHWITFKKEQRLDWQKDYLTRLCEADPQIHETFELIQEFTTMLRERQGERLDEWLAHVEKRGVAELQSFAQGLQKDYDAVKAGLSLEWSNGQTEGQVHRLKLLKRHMKGASHNRIAHLDDAHHFPHIVYSHDICSLRYPQGYGSSRSL
jgi:transposase